MAVNSSIRTDLALEAHELACAASGGKSPDGVEYREETDGCVKLMYVKVTNENGEKSTGKKIGEYVTADIGRLWKDETETFKQKVQYISKTISKMISGAGGGKCVLVAGLGNRSITADAIGPRSIDSLLVTRHIKNTTPLIFEKLGLCDVAAITPGVLGQTGIESADILKSLSDKIKPDMLIAIDALASRRLSRLATTVQFGTDGISPGSGIGNNRQTISSETLGIPVISIGVPTVVDAATLAADAIEAVAAKSGVAPEYDYEKIKEVLCEGDLNFFVTPKETDIVLKSVSELIGYSINLALNPNLNYEEMLSLV
ncbi:MAG: GPR endopeptidase [Oscillospiraceae bacterium]|nr:GPR endopeptidase [Oscillospiraceae bacterium]